jgi:hypothetical protein
VLHSRRTRETCRCFFFCPTSRQKEPNQARPVGGDSAWNGTSLGPIPAIRWRSGSTQPPRKHPHLFLSTTPPPASRHEARR